MKKWLLLAGAVLLWLQYGIWFGPSGYFARASLQQQLDQQLERVAVLRQRNRLLTGEVVRLKQDRSVLEAKARRDLGLIKTGEVFYLVPDA